MEGAVWSGAPGRCAKGEGVGGLARRGRKGEKAAIRMAEGEDGRGGSEQAPPDG